VLRRGGLLWRGGLVINGGMDDRMGVLRKDGSTIQMAVLDAPTWAIIRVVIALLFTLDLFVR